MPLHAKLKNVVGGKTTAALEKQFGFVTVEDLVRHYPRRYAERGELTDLTALAIGESVTVFAEVESVSKRTMRARKGTILDAVVTDGKGRLTLTFFNQAWRERELRPGRRGLFAGEVSAFRGTRQLAYAGMIAPANATSQFLMRFASEMACWGSLMPCERYTDRVRERRSMQRCSG